MTITQTPSTILMLMTATPTWLQLSRTERTTLTTTTVQPLLEKDVERVQVRFFDAEAFAARSSDFAIFTTLDLKAYFFLIEELRDTAMFTTPYFVVNEVILGRENGYQAFEELAQQAIAPETI